jgi:hypothetical protein
VAPLDVDYVATRMLPEPIPVSVVVIAASHFALELPAMRNQSAAESFGGAAGDPFSGTPFHHRGVNLARPAPAVRERSPSARWGELASGARYRGRISSGAFQIVGMNAATNAALLDPGVVT